VSVSFSSEVGLSTLALPETTESVEVDNHDGIDVPPKELPRSQSERMLAVSKEHVLQERELQEKYHENMFTTVEKVMRSSQSSQLKTLQALYERETADVKRKLQANRHEEVCFYLALNNYLLLDGHFWVKISFHLYCIINWKGYN
jgi:hypothetical protein